ncbi:MAG: hypothetical protein ACOX7E_05640 [Paludibacter sp.]|jgi:hypothetical protein|nr:hypothetical protein [Bacteroidales bacterium]
MKKNSRFFLVLMAIFAITPAAILTSCKDNDDDDPVVDDSQVTLKVKITYSVDLADTWYEFYNVEITYTGSDGNSETKIIQENQEESMTLFKNEAPDTVAFKVIAKPKDTPPEVEDGKVYSLDHSANLSVVTMTEDGKEVTALFSEPTNATLKSGGDAFRQALQKERQLYNRSYSIKK